MRVLPPNGILWRIPTPSSSKLSVELIANRYPVKSQIEQMKRTKNASIKANSTVNDKLQICHRLRKVKHTLFALQNPTIANDETQCNSIMGATTELNK